MIVLSFESINVNARDVFEERFGAWVVEEKFSRSEDGDHFRLLVQFPDAQAVERFQEEIDEYKVDSEDARSLPPGLRRNFFDALESVDQVSRDDRTGPRLRLTALDGNEFYLDVDLWHPGSPIQARQVLGDLRQLCERYDGRVLEHLRTDSLLLAKVRATPALLDALLDYDAVARVDLPALFAETYLGDLLEGAPDAPAQTPTPDDPIACVLDSGVVPGHPLLRGWVIEERDFDSGEGTPVDLNGHGTSVAGLVVYGDVAECIDSGLWVPRVSICSAKVMRDEVDESYGRTGRAVFPEEHRVEKVIEDAIRYYQSERACRVFNLSMGDESEIYDGGRQFPLAEKLDELARELDIVIVVSAGNCSRPTIPVGARTREQMQEALLDSLRQGSQRICNPATAALALSVGALARTDALATEDGSLAVRDAMPAAPPGGPAPFTRTGPGYSIDDRKDCVKPDLVHYGGNLALMAPAGGEPKWREHILLGEPTIRRAEGSGRLLCAPSGTSLAAPHVASLAASSAISLREALGREPSANLIRAIIGNSCEPPSCGSEWLGTEEDYSRIVGYGLPVGGPTLWSTESRVVLMAEDALPEDSLHIYRIPIPASFLEEAGRRTIKVSLAFDPPVRASRKEYLSRTMWFDLMQGLTPDQIREMKGQYAGEDQPTAPAGTNLDLRPTKTHTMWSTLQVRAISWLQRPRPRLAEGDTTPVLHLVIGCQKRFEAGVEPHQDYGVAVSFWHESERVELYQELRASMRVPAVRIRARG